MKKLGWMIPVGIVVIALTLAITAVMVGMSHLNANDLGMSVGRCLETKGGYMLIDGNSPISMADRSKDQDLFEGLSSGDRILVIHGLIMDTYPGQTSAYYCLRLEEGDLEDISRDVLDSLQEMGWLETQDGK